MEPEHDPALWALLRNEESEPLRLEQHPQRLQQALEKGRRAAEEPPRLLHELEQLQLFPLQARGEPLAEEEFLEVTELRDKLVGKAEQEAAPLYRLMQEQVRGCTADWSS